MNAAMEGTSSSSSLTTREPITGAELALFVIGTCVGITAGIIYCQSDEED